MSFINQLSNSVLTLTEQLGDTNKWFSSLLKNILLGQMLRSGVLQSDNQEACIVYSVLTVVTVLVDSVAPPLCLT